MKKIISLVLLLVLSLSLVGCKKNSIDDKVIVVGASITPHAEILEQARGYIESKGYKLDIKTYTDYILPNVALSEGELDANFFQHGPYLEDYNNKNNTNLISVLSVHYEPLGIYAGVSNDIKNIKNGAKIAVPNDSTNYARSLLLLQALNIIEVDSTKGLLIKNSDITKNPYNVEIITFNAASLPAQLSEVDFAVINGNYAESSKVDSSKLLAQEDAESVAAKIYANIVVVNKGNENKEAIIVLVEALSQSNISQFIKEKYHNTVLPL